MPLAPGTRLGSYEIAAPLGAGGMGEVYRARDTRLGREVAIKVLPDLFARDPDRLARFEHEARLLAALNHPHIAAIYGLEEAAADAAAGPVRFLVLELVEGETLAQRIARGPLPPDEALPVARQIAEALEAAHERGIIHRDLKPANIKVTPDGQVKVLDFGLAKAFGPREASPGPSPAGPLAAGTPPLDLSPTLTTPATFAGTQAGVILGTAAYMSPEQARGKPLDRRADIWAFGCVLYECLTGRQAFGGETVSDTIARILEREPDWKSLPGALDEGVTRLLGRCLQKDASLRLRDAGEARIQLGKSPASPVGPAARWSGQKASGRRWRPIAWIVPGVVIGIVISWFSLAPERRTSDAVVRATITLPQAARLQHDGYFPLALSPDGRRFAYVGTNGRTSQVYLRDLDRLDPTPVAGTEGADSLFFSPDGQWVGFIANNTLRKVPVSGGPTEVLCDAKMQGATWGMDESIFFTMHFKAGLWQVPSQGGTPRAVTVPLAENKEIGHWFPEALPDGRSLLFQIWGFDSLAGFRIALMDLRTHEKQILIEGSNPRYARSGHLVYLRSGNLCAVPFDLASRQVTGPPVVMIEAVRAVAPDGAAHFSLSSNGTLIYSPAIAAARRLAWIDRHGNISPASQQQDEFRGPSLSPDGSRLAVTIARGGVYDVWIGEISRDTFTRLTLEGREKFSGIWNPDGTQVAHAMATPQWDIYSTPANSSRAPEQLLKSEYDKGPSSWSSDGQSLAYGEWSPETDVDIWVLTPGGTVEQRPLIRTAFREMNPSFSPDGRWLAYSSNESGRDEIYVIPFPGPGGKRQISSGGGMEPRWSAQSGELFYISGGVNPRPGTSQVGSGTGIMAVKVQTRPTFRAGKPERLFERQFRTFGWIEWSYDVAPDGQKFLMVMDPDDASESAQLLLVLNFFEELKRRVPRGKN